MTFETFPKLQMGHEQHLASYLTEAQGLSVVAASTLFPEILHGFENYPAWIDASKRDRSIGKVINKLSANSRILESSIHSDLLRKVFYAAHVAACCDLFSGWSFHPDELQAELLENRIRVFLNANRDLPPETLLSIDAKFHSMDAVRTLQILRLLGLVQANSSLVRQLSLGAGQATKDLYSIHKLPNIKQSTVPDGSVTKLLFTAEPVSYQDAMVTDFDPQREEEYRLYSQIEVPRTIAINDEMYSVLDSLPATLKEYALQARNFIVALRIDHRMLRDVDTFFKLLLMSVADIADLIVTIGSGFTVEDFKGRINKMAELYDWLIGCGLRPTLIKLHGKGTVEEQRNTNHFGVADITTYQILHCKLKRKKLGKYING